MPKYRIGAKYWDGEKPHPVGAVLDFPEGKAPRGSKLVEEAKPATTAKVAKKED